MLRHGKLKFPLRNPAEAPVVLKVGVLLSEAVPRMTPDF